MITARFFGLFTGVFATAVSCHPQPQKPKYNHVVLVHGIFEDGKAFSSLKNRLEHHGIRCYVPQLKPADAYGGIDELAVQLKAGIENEFGAETDFALIGFSMGGLVSRYYLQNLGGADHCREFITISTPHNGTKVAFTYPGKGTTQMRPNSAFLQNLRATENRLSDIPITSMRTPMDLMILPPSSSIWDRAENVCYTVPLHPLMLHSNKVLDHVESKLLHPLPKAPLSP